jgi:hypothetical protein
MGLRREVVVVAGCEVVEVEEVEVVRGVEEVVEVVRDVEVLVGCVVVVLRRN